MRNSTLATQRLVLLPAESGLLQADLRDRGELGRLLAARVPPDWPPPLTDRAALEWTLAKLKEHPSQRGWLLYYWVFEDVRERILIGLGGFKGKPSEDGTVEIGYSVLKKYQRRGFACEAVAGLVAWAFSHPRVRRVFAETLPALAPSIRVLEKNRFVLAGEGSEKGVIRFELTR